MSGAVDLSGLKERAAAPAPAEGGSAVVVDVTEATFEAEVLLRSQQVPVVVSLYTPRSAPSVELSDTLAGLAAAGGGRWALARVDVDTNPRIAQAFGVQSVPTVVAVAAEQPLADFQGPQPESQLTQWIDAILQATEGKLAGAPAPAGTEPEPDPRFTAAEELLGTGDYAGAAAAYQGILDAEPANAEAQAALRQTRFLERVDALAPDAVATADAAPDDIDAQLAASDVQVAQGDPAAGFARLVDLVKRTSGDERGRVRAHLVELFELFDAADPVVTAARRQLALALY